jgi:hypothetical protein
MIYNHTFTAVLRMNPSEALEWLLENRAEEEPEDAVDLKHEAASVCPRRQQETAAAGKMRYDMLTVAAQNVPWSWMVETAILEGYTASISEAGHSTFLQIVNNYSVP